MKPENVVYPKYVGENPLTDYVDGPSITPEMIKFIGVSAENLRKKKEK